MEFNLTFRAGAFVYCGDRRKQRTNKHGLSVEFRCFIEFSAFLNRHIGNCLRRCPELIVTYCYRIRNYGRFGKAGAFKLHRIVNEGVFIFVLVGFIGDGAGRRQQKAAQSHGEGIAERAAHSVSIASLPHRYNLGG